MVLLLQIQVKICQKLQILLCDDFYSVILIRARIKFVSTKCEIDELYTVNRKSFSFLSSHQM
jgi:phage gp16-like protein